MRNQYLTKKKIISYGLIPFFCASLWGLPKPWDPDEAGRVQILSQALRIDEKLQLFLAEDFEGNRPWAFYRPDSFLSYTEFTAQIPNQMAFGEESLLFQNVPAEKKQNYTSFLIQSYVENPRLDHWELRPKEIIPLPLGVPTQGFIWVFSEGHHIQLSVAFTQKKSKPIYFDLGTLNFYGWRRLEFTIQMPRENLRLIQSMFFPIALHSLRLKSLPTQNKGEFHLYFDNLSFVIDKRSFLYPGSEVQDTWGSKR